MFIYPKDKKNLFKKDQDLKAVKFTFTEQKGDTPWTFKVARLRPSVEDVLNEADQKDEQQRRPQTRREAAKVNAQPQKKLGAPARTQSLDKVPPSIKYAKSK